MELNKKYEANGLNSHEIKERTEKNLINYDTTPKTKTIPNIILEHTITLFNIINIALAVIVLFFGSVKNILFMGVVFSNAFIGIFQEIRAKKSVDRLSIINKAKITTIRNGYEEKISVNEILKDELILLYAGNQIPSDCIIIDGECDVNESLLTGESDLIHKKVGDELLSGSFIVSGTVKARVTHIAEENYASKILNKSKYVKKNNSEILRTLNSIIFFLSFVIIPVGCILCYAQINIEENTLSNAVISTIAALIGMIPEGLVLLTSTVLAVSVIRLSKKNVLIQQLYCIESLARVNVLCLDKTGTITEGNMKVSQIDYLGNNETEIKKILFAIVDTLKDNNATGKAIEDYCKTSYNFNVTKKFPFSSDKKFSGITINNEKTYIIGAGEFILKGSEFEKYNKLINDCDRCRVLVLAETSTVSDPLSNAKLLSIIYIKDVIRKSAKQTLRYFKNQGVSIKIISGDNPSTVSQIAKEVEFEDYDKYVDMSTINNITPDLVEKYSIFGRVTPEQKKLLIGAIKSSGNVVGMTGDGVNDVPALKEADCSIAMASGSDAAKNVAEIVLLDSDFASMPDIVNEGRRTINNIQRSASLFLVKTIFSSLLAIFFSILPLAYPFKPIQMTLLSSFTIGIPSFVLALETNFSKIKGNFLSNVISKAFPTAITVILSVLLSTICSKLFFINSTECSTICVYITALCGLMMLFKISSPFNLLRRTLFILMTLCVVCSIVFFGEFFYLTTLTSKAFILFLVVAVFAILCFFAIWKTMDKFFKD